jgi:hypothetical protein
MTRTKIIHDWAKVAVIIVTIAVAGGGWVEKIKVNKKTIDKVDAKAEANCKEIQTIKLNERDTMATNKNICDTLIRLETGQIAQTNAIRKVESSVQKMEKDVAVIGQQVKNLERVE